MSNALALAAVTAVLKDLLDNGLIDRNVSGTIGSPVTVSALPPDRVKTGESDPTQLDLFLYNVAPNAAWRNADLPSANGRGERIANPPLALDLSYLLIAYGKQDFEAEILLGYAMQVLHETPVLTRAAIRRSLSPTSPVGGGLLPPPLSALPAAELADQVELVKLTPQPMSTEEISRLWSALQTNYRPSVAYLASVVLIEGTRPTRSPLPVLTRGALDEGVIVTPDTTAPPPAVPTLLALHPPNDQPAARLGETVTVEGVGLAGATVSLRLAHPRLPAPISLAPQPDATAASLRFAIPNQPANFAAGICTAAVSIVPQPGQPPQLTNELALPLAPTILTVSPNPAPRDANGRVTLTVTCAPQVRPAQRASLFVGAREVPSQPHPTAVASLTFRIDAAPPGRHWLRLRVDGVDSLLVDRSVTPPVFIASQQVTIT